MSQAKDFIFSKTAVHGPRGLVNIGNFTCYVNAALQCLLGSSEFANFFHVPSLEDKINSKSRSLGLVASQLRLVYENLKDQTALHAHLADYFLDVVKSVWPAYEDEQQMCSAEFLIFLLSSLHNELTCIHINEGPTAKEERRKSYYAIDINPNPAVADDWWHLSWSPISEIFHHQLLSFSLCINCDQASLHFDDVGNVLSLNVVTGPKASLQDCLRSFFEEELIKDGRCGKCGGLGLKKRLILGRLPHVLIIQLKRFAFNITTKTSSKISRHVAFDCQIEMSQYCVRDLQTCTLYNLVGVVNHIGSSLQSGHFITLSKRGDRWFCLDDSRVTSSTQRQLCSSAAYLLIFERDGHGGGDLPFDGCGPHQNTLDAAASVAQSVDNVCDLQSSESEDPFNVLDDEENVCHNASPTLNSSDDLFASLEADGMLEIRNDAASKDLLESLSHSQLEDAPDTALDTGVFNSTTPPQYIHQSSDRNAATDSIGAVGPCTPVWSQCDHPNLDLDTIDPVLLEEDIPGAKLDLDNLQQYVVPQLQFWLACRGLPQDGRKEQLITRILNHRRKAQKIFPGVKGGKYYERKRQKVLKEAYDERKRFPIMPAGTGVWHPFPSVHIPDNYSSAKVTEYLANIPLFRFSHTEGVIAVEEVGSDDDEVFDFTQPTQEGRKAMFVASTLKRADLFIRSKKIREMLDCVRDKHYYVKAEVRASFRDLTYNLSTMIARASGNVCLAECSCKALALGRCCHITAILLLIGRHVQRHGHEAVTTTSRSCYWIVPGSSRIRDPGVVRERDEYYDFTQYLRRGHFDPRPDSIVYASEEEVALQLKHFKDSLAKLESKVLWALQLEPPPEAPQFPDSDMTEALAEQCSYVMWNLNLIRRVSQDRPLHFPKTRGQASSESWQPERQIRIPASQAQRACGLFSARSTDSGKINFFRDHLWRLDQDKKGERAKRAMKYGQDNEGPAREAYRKELRKDHPDLAVIETGMWVNPKYPQLSCSPDGVITDTNGIIKILELKAPEILQNMDPNNFEKLPPSQKKSFCLKRCKETGKVVLKQSHKWYYQVQMSMDILEVKQCDFVVYSKVNDVDKMIIVQVQYNEPFWREKRERLIRLHREFLVPEFFLYNTVFRRAPFCMSYTNTHEDFEDNYFWRGCSPTYDMSVEDETEMLLNS